MDPSLVNGVFSIPLPGEPLTAEPESATGLHRAAGLREFIAGPENVLLRAAIDEFLLTPQTPYNPLVLVGPSGAGKSHLARGIALEWHRRRPAATVLCIDAADFAREFSLAVETQGTGEFRDYYRTCELLVLEDLAHLKDKPAAEQELMLTLDALVELGSRIVVTAPFAPAELTFLSPMLRSRLTGGLVVPVARPDVLTRMELLRRLAAQRSLRLTDAAVTQLAESLDAAVPQLEGALMFLQASNGDRDGHEIDATQVAEYLASRDERPQPTLREIATQTAKHFALKVTDLRSPSRRRTVATARYVAMFLARELTADSLVQIGGYFGGRDHATVLHGCRRTEELLRTDQQTQQAVTCLRQTLQPL
jgi:chromosomal replication initiator protein